VELVQHQGQARRVPGKPFARVDRAGALRWPRRAPCRGGADHVAGHGGGRASPSSPAPPSSGAPPLCCELCHDDPRRAPRSIGRADRRYAGRRLRILRADAPAAWMCHVRVPCVDFSMPGCPDLLEVFPRSDFKLKHRLGSGVYQHEHRRQWLFLLCIGVFVCRARPRLLPCRNSEFSYKIAHHTSPKK
jgi:hypothetical protein